jgi:hypothetical protein
MTSIREFSPAYAFCAIPSGSSATAQPLVYNQRIAVTLLIGVKIPRRFPVPHRLMPLSPEVSPARLCGKTKPPKFFLEKEEIDV